MSEEGDQKPIVCVVLEHGEYYTAGPPSQQWADAFLNRYTKKERENMEIVFAVHPRKKM